MIKEFSIDDFPKCNDLFVQVFNGAPWHDKWTTDTANNYLRELIENNRFFGFTLWDNTVLVGTILCHAKNHYKGEEIFVDELFVSPDYQRKGHGMELMDAVDNFARENHFISVTLLTGKEKPSFHFFEKCGCKYLPYLAFMYKRIE